MNECDLLKDDAEPLKLQVRGTVGFSKSVKNLSKNYPILNRIVPVMLSDSDQWSWGSYQIVNCYGINVVQSDIDCTQLSNINIVKETSMFDIKSNDEYLLIDLK